MRALTTCLAGISTLAPVEAALGLDRAGRRRGQQGLTAAGFRRAGRTGCRTGDASDAPELTDVAGRGGSNGVPGRGGATALGCRWRVRPAEVAAVTNGGRRAS